MKLTRFDVKLTFTGTFILFLLTLWTSNVHWFTLSTNGGIIVKTVLSILPIAMGYFDVSYFLLGLSDIRAKKEAEEDKKVQTQKEKEVAYESTARFLIPVSQIFKGYKFIYEPISTMRRLTRIITSLYSACEIPLRPVEQIAGLGTIELRFEPERTTVYKNGEERQIITDVRKIRGQLENLKRELGGREDVLFNSVVPGTTNVSFMLQSSRRNKAGMKNILFCESFESVIKYNKFNQCVNLPMALGYTTTGEEFVFDFVQAPHILIGSTTGGGKTNLQYAMLTSMLSLHSPSTLELHIVDTKGVDFVQFQKLPHLGQDIITTPNDAIILITSMIKVMEDRYVFLRENKKRTIVDYNLSIKNPEDYMPFIVINIDEFADLRGASLGVGELDANIERLAQMGRACGIHLCLATQRPDVKVVTGIISANMPTRFGLRTTNDTNSRIIIGKGGCETLYGKGDCLAVLPEGNDSRFQSILVEQSEIAMLTKYWNKKVKGG